MEENWLHRMVTWEEWEKIEEHGLRNNLTLKEEIIESTLERWKKKKVLLSFKRGFFLQKN